MKSEHHGGQIGDARSCFELPSHRRHHGQFPVKQTVDVRFVMPRAPSNLGDGEVFGPDQMCDVESHVLKSVASLQNCQGAHGAENWISLQNHVMPRWKYRDAFDEDYLALKKRTGWSHEEIAGKLGKSVHMVASYRRKGESGSVAPDDVIWKFAALTGKSPFNYMDNPFLAECIGLEAYATIPQWKRDILQRNLRGLNGSSLPPQVWEMLLDSLLSQAREVEAALNAGKK